MLRSLTQDATLAALKCSKDLSVRFFSLFDDHPGPFDERECNKRNDFLTVGKTGGREMYVSSARADWLIEVCQPTLVHTYIVIHTDYCNTGGLLGVKD